MTSDLEGLIVIPAASHSATNHPTLGCRSWHNVAIGTTSSATAEMKSSQNGLHKKGGFLAASFGDNITLRCTSSEVGAKLNWFRQKWGMKPVLISSYFKYDQNREFYKEFRSNNHFKMDYGDDKNDLSIMNVSSSDSAVYHCVRSFLHQSDFQESVTVIVKSLHPTAEVRQSPHEEIEPGHSVILHCSVQTDSCVGQHRVHWFKQSEESAAGLLYSHGGSSDQCESNTDGPNNPCVYNLPIHNVSSQQTGTYYCAVAACGQVLFGNGTRVNMKDAAATGHPVLYTLAGALTFTVVFVLLLALSLYNVMKKNKRQNRAPECEDNGSSSTTGNTQNEPDHLHYAALSINRKLRSQRNSDPVDCVYSRIQVLG
ncbi:uncharacterized protein LOC117370937 [Periophthalmus magnuspinnatus]|uniref:uncharacterized protein LOC117370937 n=1 Tax=Periophthalmus magnuspinnatus TaxID=409849 RepID=UPI00145A73BB|nr:uncharacterized protein LOC117370937 [Periophthalmus magnuspinnatus]